MIVMKFMVHVIIHPDLFVMVALWTSMSCHARSPVVANVVTSATSHAIQSCSYLEFRHCAALLLVLPTFSMPSLICIHRSRLVYNLQMARHLAKIIMTPIRWERISRIKVACTTASKGQGGIR